MASGMSAGAHTTSEHILPQSPHALISDTLDINIEVEALISNLIVSYATRNEDRLLFYEQFLLPQSPSG